MSKENTPINNYSQFFDTPGEMARLIRAYDWAQSSLGSPNTWSLSLLNAVGILLRAQCPMLLWWGNDLIQFYNDGYRLGLGHVANRSEMLGKRAEDCWAEAWALIRPQIDVVMKDGFANLEEAELLPIYKNWRSEPQGLCWTYSFSKVIDAQGGVGGVLVIINETAKKVIADKKMTETLMAMAENEKRLRYLLADAPVPIAVLQGESLIIETVNKKMLEVLHRLEESVIGIPTAMAIPELEKQGLIDMLKSVYLTGEPFYGNEVRLFIEAADNRIDDLYTTFVFQPIKNESGATTHIMVVANVITEQVLARKQAEQAEEMLRLSIEAANVGTWVMDMNTKFLVASDRLKELFGFESTDEVTLECLMSKVPDGHARKIKDDIEQALLTGEDYINEHQIIVSADQKERWVRALGKMYVDEVTHVKQFTGLMIDITEQKNDDRRKNDFIGMVSHELKTPITSLSAYLQLLLVRSKKDNDTFSSDILSRANNQVRKMSALINGFLNVSRLESGKIQLNKEDFNLTDLINEVVEETVITASTHLIKRSLPATVMVNADYDKIFSVMSNLIGNAVKYSNNGTEISIGVETVDGNIIVHVKDEGMGINKNERKKIFDRYYRAESNIAKHISGFGIGLYLSAEIIERHEGEIWVDTEMGVGSTFYFSLPA